MRKICGYSTELQTPVNVGRRLTVILYTVFFRAQGFNCTVTCGKAASSISDGCGVSQSSKELVGGAQVPNQNKYPWMVHITDANGQLFFGGSLINDRYVLTSARQVKL
ncbi:unnamed protein product, partial [Darwinula stevensoni]